MSIATRRRLPARLLLVLPLTLALTLGTLLSTQGAAAAGRSDLSDVTLTIGDPCLDCMGALLKASGEATGMSYHLQYANFDSTPTLISAMQAGRVDVAEGGETGVLFGIANGAKITFLAGLQEHDVGGSVVLVPHDSSLHSVAQLKGQKVALPFYTAQHYQFAKALQKAGLSWSQVQVENLDTSQGLSALNTGQVAAFVIWDPNAAIAQTQYHAKVLVHLSTVVQTYSAYYASDAALADPGKKAALKDLTKRLVKAEAWAQTHKNEWAQEVTKLTGTPLAASQLAASRSDTTVVPLDSAVISQWQQETDFFYQQGQFKTNFKVKSVVDTGFNSVVTGASSK